MEKIVIGAASCYNQKYFLNPEFDTMPVDTKKLIKIICVSLAEKLHCIFTIGFYTNGDVYFETQDNDFDFDEINAIIEIEKIKKEEAELIKSLKLWYVVFKTEEGHELRADLHKQFSL